MKAFEAAGIAVYALSYDEADALRDFGEAHGITFNLISDPDSEIIRSFGILNTLIAADDHPWFGIPYPGTYVIGANGVITHKFFDNNLAVRTGPEQLLRAFRGEPMPEPLLKSEADAAALEAVEVHVALEGDALAASVQRDLVARFRVPAGRHVYAAPAPQGMVAVDIVLDEVEGLVQREVVRPVSEPHVLAGTKETFEVHHDLLELRLPLTVSNPHGGIASEIAVSGEVRWQSCDDETCDIPSSHRFELVLPVSEGPPVALFGKAGPALEPNAMSHFKRMSERRARTD